MEICYPEDFEYLVKAVAGVREQSYAAYVGIAAVIMNRIADVRYPDTAAGVIAAGDLLPLPGGGLIDEREYRLVYDACTAAYMGADPTGGALNFTVSYEAAETDDSAENTGFKPYVVIGKTAFF